MAEGMRTAEQVLRVLAPTCSPNVKARMRRESIITAADLAGLDKEDMRELGFTMVERSRILRWSSLGNQEDTRIRITSKPSSPMINAAAPEVNQEHIAPLELALMEAQRQSSMPGRQMSSNSIVADMEEEQSDLEEQRLDEIEQRADFWFKIIADSGAASLRNDVEQVAERLRAEGDTADFHDLRENLLEKLFDLSHEHLKEVYESIDMDSDGQILKEELREGLHRCELHGLDGALEKVLKVVGHDGTLQLAEFESVLTRLKLAQLLAHKGANSAYDGLTVMDYNQHVVKLQGNCLRSYIFGHRTHEFPRRWVHLRSFDLTLLLALTVKYQLSPLSVEDVIDQSPTRMDRNGPHYFATIEHLCITSLTNGQEPVQVRGRHISIFCAGPSNFDTVITIAQADRSFAQDWPGEASSAPSPKDDDWVERLQKRLKAVRSRVRERRSDFLMNNIIDLCADDLTRVTKAYATRLIALEDDFGTLFIKDEWHRGRWLNEVRLIQLQLAVVKRRLRGLQRILRRLADDTDLAQTLAGYIQDISDHVNEAHDDAGHCIEKCSSRMAAYEHEEDRMQEMKNHEQARNQILQDERMNRMLFVLTILTTIFTPLTFMAGVYGMNFQDKDGHPSIPELNWPNGYLYFWLFSLLYLALAGFVSHWLWRRLNGAIQEEHRPVPIRQRSVRVPTIRPATDAYISFDA